MSGTRNFHAITADAAKQVHDSINKALLARLAKCSWILERLSAESSISVVDNSDQESGKFTELLSEF